MERKVQKAANRAVGTILELNESMAQMKEYRKKTDDRINELLKSEAFSMEDKIKLMQASRDMHLRMLETLEKTIETRLSTYNSLFENMVKASVRAEAGLRVFQQILPGLTKIVEIQRTIERRGSKYPFDA